MQVGRSFSKDEIVQAFEEISDAATAQDYINNVYKDSQHLKAALSEVFVARISRIQGGRYEDGDNAVLGVLSPHVDQSAEGVEVALGQMTNLGLAQKQAELEGREIEEDDDDDEQERERGNEYDEEDDEDGDEQEPVIPPTPPNFIDAVTQIQDSYNYTGSTFLQARDFNGDDEDAHKAKIRRNMLDRLKVGDIDGETGDRLDKIVDGVYSRFFKEDGTLRGDIKGLRTAVEEEVNRLLVQAYLIQYPEAARGWRIQDIADLSDEEYNKVLSKAFTALESRALSAESIEKAIDFSEQGKAERLKRWAWSWLGVPKDAIDSLAKNKYTVAGYATGGIIIASLFIPGAFPTILLYLGAVWGVVGAAKAVDKMLQNPIGKAIFATLVVPLTALPLSLVYGLGWAYAKLTGKDPQRVFDAIAKFLPRPLDSLKYIKNYGNSKKEPERKRAGNKGEDTAEGQETYRKEILERLLKDVGNLSPMQIYAILTGELAGFLGERTPESRALNTALDARITQLGFADREALQAAGDRGGLRAAPAVPQTVRERVTGAATNMWTGAKETYGRWDSGVRDFGTKVQGWGEGIKNIFNPQPAPPQQGGGTQAPQGGQPGGGQQQVGQVHGAGGQGVQQPQMQQQHSSAVPGGGQQGQQPQRQGPQGGQPPQQPPGPQNMDAAAHNQAVQAALGAVGVVQDGIGGSDNRNLPNAKPQPKKEKS